MKLNSFLRLVPAAAALVAVAAATTACNRTEILFKPSAEMDPMPSAADDQPEGKDPLQDKQWYLAKIGVDSTTLTSGVLTGNKNVRVAVLSTGIDYNHEDLVGRVAVNKAELSSNEPSAATLLNQKDDDNNGLVDDFVGYDVVSGDGLAFDRHGAGTAVAGLIAARQNNGKGISGLMSDVTLFPVRYIDDNGQTSVPSLLAALDVVAKARPSVVFLQSVSVRLGGRENTAEVAATELTAIGQRLDALRTLGIPVVVGAGSDNSIFGTKKIEALLKQYDNVVVVTSSNEKDQKVFLANYSPQYVATTGPGTAILTTAPSNGYAEVSSTSMAAAQVTAAFALATVKHGPVPYKKLIAALTSDEGGDAVEDLAQLSIGRNRVNLPKFLGAVAK